MLMLFGSTILGHLETAIAGCDRSTLSGTCLASAAAAVRKFVTAFDADHALERGDVFEIKTKWWLVLFGAVGGLNTLVRGGNLALPILLGAGLLIVAFRRKHMHWKPLTRGLLLATRHLFSC
jgi:hypothetical protein